ncbi:MAG: RNA polymerase sigma factor [Ignavibacteria bacterium]|nr:RNA polymerase sigma factor [Ignavibacteria bacterium]
MQNNLEKLSDNELFKMLSNGDKEGEYAFLEIYRRYSNRIYAYCKRFLGDREDAMDVFQDTFIKFYQTSKDEREMTNLPAFLLRIARNLCLNALRQRRQSTEIEDYMHFINTEKDNEETELLNLIKTALSKLPEEYREIFILREYQGMSYNEIANHLNISLPLVKVRLFRAKEKLREILAPYITEFSKF